MKKNLVPILISPFLFPLSALSSDTITLKNGNRIEGEVLRVEARSGKTTVTYPSVLSVVLDDHRDRVITMELVVEEVRLERVEIKPEGLAKRIWYPRSIVESVEIEWKKRLSPESPEKAPPPENEGDPPPPE